MKKIALILTVILAATFCNNLQAQQQQETLPMSAVDVQPAFQGENAGSFARWVFTQLKYPEQAVKENLTGKVIVQFTISKTGDVKDIKVLRGAHPALDAEALRVISMSPKWTPGQVKGVLSIAADVRLMEPGSIARSQGKGKHVIDNRSLE